MKVSLSNLQFHQRMYGWSDDTAPEGAGKLIERIGAQLGAIEEVIEIDKKYDGVVIVRVVSCEQHPNADRLHVCTIDDGGVVQDVTRDENGHVQVVCGAPNVKAGVTVAWLPPGSTVPSTYKHDPFVLQARELRGVVSNGMLASPKELSIGDSHEGLLLIDEEVAPGTMFADKYGLKDDIIFDIENKMFTHRPDCFGQIGIARELAGIQGMAFHSPDWYRSDASVTDAEGEELKLEVRNEIPELVPRFTAVPISDITVAPSPVWLQVELSRLGIRPINNIVDLTNFYMMFTGQPLHAYDYDKVAAQDENNGQATLVVRKPHKNEKLTLLNGKEIEPREEAILIASHTRAIGLGGVMGGADTEVDDSTKNIILECASFDMYSIRRTSMAHGVFSDAVTRFTKGQSPLQNMAVLAKLVEDVLSVCGGRVAGPATDDNHLPEEVRERNSLYPDVKVSADFINARLGLKLSVDDMTRLLTNVEFSVGVADDTMTVRAPFWRTDIEIAEDVVEEVGRLYGFDALPLELPGRSLMPAGKDTWLQAKAELRDSLSRAGANEVLTYSFVHEQLLSKVGQNKELAFRLANALSPELQYYRLSMTPSLLDKVHANIKAGYEEFALFELGKVHAKSEIGDDGLPHEFGRLGFVYAASPKKSAEVYRGAPYYQALKYLYAVLGEQPADVELRPLHQESFDEHALFEQMSRPYEPGRSAVVYRHERPLGIIGEYRSDVQKALKLPACSAGFELFLSYFAQNLNASTTYVALPRFPKVTQDITLRVPVDHTYRQVFDSIWNKLGERQADELLMTLSPLDIYQDEQDTAHKQITLRLTVASYEKTLTDTEVTALLDEAAADAHERFGYERV